MGREGGGFGEAGQRQIIHSDAREEIGRVLQTVGWMMAFGCAIVGLLFVDALVWGPLLGVALGAVGLVWVFYRKVLPWAYWQGVRGAHWTTLGALLVALVAWGMAGYEVLSQAWPPWRLGWPLWALVSWEALSLVIKGALVWGVWGMWCELVDPNGPTAPREAVARDKVILPWDKETRGGQVVEPAERGGERVVYLPTILVERTGNGRKRSQDRALLRAPAARPEGLYQFCAALASERAFPSWEGGMSGPGAQQYGYSEAEFEDWREEAVRAWLLAARPGRNQGYELTERGAFQFGRIGERGLREAAFVLGSGA